MLAESGTGCCFVSGETGDGETGTQKPNETENDSLNRITIPLPFHLAGTQTALPSVPVPTRVSFVVVPAPFLDSKTFFLGKKVLARFLCPFLCACKEREEKNTF
jgi:hypothetical protein